MELYVYYRALGTQAEALTTRVLAMQAQLSQQYGVEASLKRRPREEAGMHTWMEVYRSAPDGFDGTLQQAAQDADLSCLIHGERHVEHFLDIASCA